MPATKPGQFGFYFIEVQGTRVIWGSLAELIETLKETFKYAVLSKTKSHLQEFMDEIPTRSGKLVYEVMSNSYYYAVDAGNMIINFTLYKPPHRPWVIKGKVTHQGGWTRKTRYNRSIDKPETRVINPNVRLLGTLRTKDGRNVYYYDMYDPVADGNYPAAHRRYSDRTFVRAEQWLNRIDAKIIINLKFKKNVLQNVKFGTKKVNLLNYTFAYSQLNEVGSFLTLQQNSVY